MVKCLQRDHEQRHFIHGLYTFAIIRNIDRRDNPRLRLQKVILMTPEEYKALYPQDQTFIQVDDTERTMTDEEYEAWVAEGVYNSNHPRS